MTQKKPKSAHAEVAARGAKLRETRDKIRAAIAACVAGLRDKYPGMEKTIYGCLEDAHQDLFHETLKKSSGGWR